MAKSNKSRLCSASLQYGCKVSSNRVLQQPFSVCVHNILYVLKRREREAVALRGKKYVINTSEIPKVMLLGKTINNDTFLYPPLLSLGHSRINKIINHEIGRIFNE